MQLDRVPSDARLPVIEVEEGDTDDGVRASRAATSSVPRVSAGGDKASPHAHRPTRATRDHVGRRRARRLEVVSGWESRRGFGQASRISGIYPRRHVREVRNDRGVAIAMRKRFHE
jgi:hypothetical protein